MKSGGEERGVVAATKVRNSLMLEVEDRIENENFWNYVVDRVVKRGWCVLVVRDACSRIAHAGVSNGGK